MSPARRALRIGTGILLALSLTAVLAAPEAGKAWSSLTPQQQQALAPLQRDWPALETQRRQKWLEVANRFETLSADERGRVQERMTEWARMSTAERTRARLQFQEVRRVPADERQARWQAYQSLAPEERQRLAQNARPAAKAASAAAPAASAPTLAAHGKSNVVQASAQSTVRSVNPAVLHARPGATTNNIGTPAAPPVHHQAGLPKIAATPGFVDSTTLLPQRGPQGAATTPPAQDRTVARP